MVVPGLGSGVALAISVSLLSFRDNSSDKSMAYILVSDLFPHAADGKHGSARFNGRRCAPALGPSHGPQRDRARVRRRPAARAGHRGSIINRNLAADTVFRHRIDDCAAKRASCRGRHGRTAAFAPVHPKALPPASACSKTPRDVDMTSIADVTTRSRSSSGYGHPSTCKLDRKSGSLRPCDGGRWEHTSAQPQVSNRRSHFDFANCAVLGCSVGVRFAHRRSSAFAAGQVKCHPKPQPYRRQ
jgi:hypothetical protein